MDRYEENYLNGPDIDRLQHQEQEEQEEQIPPHPAPTQNIVDEEELLAAQAAAEAAAAAQLQQPGGAFNNVGQGLTGVYRDMMMQYWQETINSIEHDEHDFKNHQLPLARIKKVMKTDEDVRMISAEAPILFAKGCDVFITELTMRAWIHAEENKRRTLQKSDIAAALTKSDMFDFLIDIVPRDEEKPKKSYSSLSRSGSYANIPSNSNSTNQTHIPTSQPRNISQITGNINEDREIKNDNRQINNSQLLHQQMLQQQMLQLQQQQQQNQPQNSQHQQQQPNQPQVEQAGHPLHLQPQSQQIKLEQNYSEIPDYSERSTQPPQINNRSEYQNFNFPVYD
mmetsp:Transcript_4087/g.4005  ORF Transcript_4087/g.4005 Transcript_4087/m.4005 type:complete len:339 (+) Transcript_4087:646-1662(+)